MIDDYSRDLLRAGIIDAKAGHEDSARRYLDRALYMTADHEVMAEGWYWMSRVAADPADRRRALENCLSHDLHHARARRALAILDGKLKSDEIADPDRLPPAPDGLRRADAQRFMCPKCGGRMTFAPDGQSLVCEYCTRTQALRARPGAPEKDFIIAMATLRGHSRPLNEQVFHCQGCGSEFILPPKLLSTVCVYCGSPHVVSLEKARDLLAPDGILPHAFDQRRAAKLLSSWVEENGVHPDQQADPPRGLYLPLWTFRLGGMIDYIGEKMEYRQEDASHQMPKVLRVTDQYPVMMDELPIPASRKLSAPFVRLIRTYDLRAAAAYDPRYLVDWPAEIYDVPMAEASLDARAQAYARLKRDLPDLLYPLRLVSSSSADMTVEAFRLDLLPVWTTEIWFEGRSHLALINGQNGKVESDRPFSRTEKPGGLLEWLGDLLND
jgi:hypothetical protein